MTEVVLLFPIFMVIAFIIVKTFALLVLLQKLEIASFYAARRYQLESHLNAKYAEQDDALVSAIKGKVSDYLGYRTSARGFLNLSGDVDMKVERSQVWNKVTLTVQTEQAGVKLLCLYSAQDVCAGYGPNCQAGRNYICESPKPLQVLKYVPSRDRPIAFQLPGTGG